MAHTCTEEDRGHQLLIFVFLTTFDIRIIILIIIKRHLYCAIYPGGSKAHNIIFIKLIERYNLDIIKKGNLAILSRAIITLTPLINPNPTGLF